MGARASSFEAEVAALRAENARLRRLLDLTPAQARLAAATQTGLFLDRPGPVTASSSGPDKVRLFRTLFAARTDVYAIRWENARTGRSGWSPAVEGGWRTGTNRPYLRLTDRRHRLISCLMSASNAVDCVARRTRGRIVRCPARLAAPCCRIRCVFPG
jgi:hypothetical protein